jgi:hypothetical protein
MNIVRPSGVAPAALANVEQVSRDDVVFGRNQFYYTNNIKTLSKISRRCLSVDFSRGHNWGHKKKPTRKTRRRKPAGLPNNR